MFESVLTLFLRRVNQIVGHSDHLVDRQGGGPHEDNYAHAERKGPLLLPHVIHKQLLNLATHHLCRCATRFGQQSNKLVTPPAQQLSRLYLNSS